MWGQIDGISKIEIARNVVGDLLRDWDPARHLGVVAYGHREAGRCDDIETVVEVGLLDLDRALSTVNGLQLRRRTPLSEAVRMAAEDLSYEDRPATVILLSDGVETCNADPCALGRELAQRGVNFTAHVIGFDIAEEDRADLICLAEATGGLFLPADSAGELSSAMTQVAAVRSVPEEPVAEEPPPPEIAEATLDAPDEAPAGSNVSIAWTGPDNKSDYITIVAVGAPEGSYEDYARTASGNPVQLRAPAEPGEYEIRYVIQQSGRTLTSRAVTVGGIEVTLSVNGQVAPGGVVEVEWTGPGRYEDFIQIVPAGSEDNAPALRETRSTQGSPLQLFARPQAGDSRYATAPPTAARYWRVSRCRWDQPSSGFSGPTA